MRSSARACSSSFSTPQDKERKRPARQPVSCSIAKSVLLRKRSELLEGGFPLGITGTFVFQDAGTFNKSAASCVVIASSSSMTRTSLPARSMTVVRSMTPVSDAAKSIMISGDVPAGALRRRTEPPYRTDIDSSATMAQTQVFHVEGGYAVTVFGGVVQHLARASNAIAISKKLMANRALSPVAIGLVAMHSVALSSRQ